QIVELKTAYRIVYRRGLSAVDAAEVLASRFTAGAPLDFAAFLKTGKRGFLQERRTPPGAVLRVFSNSTDQSIRMAG
ncbi:MAG: hypothetical protein KY448_06200, partial [Cyanobacteria bacterium 0813]|nr:hypothetical protein [Cyanobacteria bacterium 0813]